MNDNERYLLLIDEMSYLHAERKFHDALSLARQHPEFADKKEMLWNLHVNYHAIDDVPNSSRCLERLLNKVPQAKPLMRYARLAIQNDLWESAGTIIERVIAAEPTELASYSLLDTLAKVTTDDAVKQKALLRQIDGLLSNMPVTLSLLSRIDRLIEQLAPWKDIHAEQSQRFQKVLGMLEQQGVFNAIELGVYRLPDEQEIARQNEIEASKRDRLERRGLPAGYNPIYNRPDLAPQSRVEARVLKGGRIITSNEKGKLGGRLD